jgi:glycosyltransferase 2 family protein
MEALAVPNVSGPTAPSDGSALLLNMLSRERVLRFGATAAERTRVGLERRAVRLLGRLLALALLVVLAVRLWQLWRREPVDFGAVDLGVFVAAVVASVAAVSAYGLVWLFLLRRLGTHAPLSWMALFFKSQLAKYLPGSVWQYAGRVGLASGRGVPVQRAVVSVAGEIGYSALAAAAAASLILGSIAAAGVFVGLGLLLPLGARLVRRVSVESGGRGLDRPSVSAALRAAPATVGLYLIVWGLYGLAFWATGRALFAVPWSDLPHYIGVFALAWLAGLVAFFAPGGIGVREAVIAALLANRLGQADAIVVAATSRIILSAVDLVAGAASFGLPALRRRETQPVEAGR